MEPRAETPAARGARMLRDAGYRSEGGKVTMPRVKKTVRRAIVEHEDEEHGGRHGRIKLKSGGAVTGKEPKSRPDRRARRDLGGTLPPQVGAAPNPQMTQPPQPTPQQIAQMQAMRAQQAQQTGNMPPGMAPGAGPTAVKRGGGVKRRARGGDVFDTERRDDGEGADRDRAASPSEERRRGGGIYDMDRHNDGQGADRNEPTSPTQERRHGGRMRARGGSTDEFNMRGDSDAFEEREKFDTVDNDLSAAERDRDEGRSRGGRARRAEGGYVGIHQEHDDMKIDGRQHRAEGGMLEAPRMPGMGGGKPKSGGKGGAKTINVIVGHGDDGDQKAQMAHQAGMQQGMQMGAQRARMAAAPPPPHPPMMPPGGMPPGAGPGGPPMMAGGPGAPRPPMPPGGGGMPMAARGGRLGRAEGGAVRVREHHRRKAGGKC